MPSINMLPSYFATFFGSSLIRALARELLPHPDSPTKETVSPFLRLKLYRLQLSLFPFWYYSGDKDFSPPSMNPTFFLPI
jgi:hypothetical protein